MEVTKNLSGTRREIDEFFNMGGYVRHYKELKHIEKNIFLFEARIRVSENFRIPRALTVKAYIKALKD
jgi:hypothetical protein